jgi:hypothetical protein
MNPQRNYTLFAIAFLLIVNVFSVQAQLKPIPYDLNLTKSKILWKAPENHGGSKHFGFLLFYSGSLQTNVSGDPINGTFSLNMNSISSADRPTEAENKKLDDQLKSDDFFNTIKYPKAIMVVTKILHTKTPGVYAVTGDLTMKDVTNTIYFTATIKKEGNMITVSGNLVIDRLRWNIKNMDGDFFGGMKSKLIEEDIPLTLSLVFAKRNN